MTFVITIFCDIFLFVFLRFFNLLFMHPVIMDAYCIFYANTACTSRPSMLLGSE